MTKALRTVAVGLGLTTICLAWLVEPLVKSTHETVYHWSGRSYLLFGPVAFAVAVVWAACALLLLSTQRPGRWRVAVWAGVLLCLPWIALRNVHLLWPNALGAWFHFPRFYVAIILWVLVVLLWRPAYSKRCDLVIDFASTVLAFVALSGALFLSQMLWFWWQGRALNASRPLHQQQRVSAMNQPKPRMIWIVLDELSYQQVYERRYPGLQLPTFDELATESTIFTQVSPAGNFTEKALPSLLTGRTVGDVRSSAGGELSVYLAASGWQKFDERDTIFEDALQDGYRTAVAGWYNPYCRIVPGVLDRCYWTDGYTLDSGLSSNGTFWSNVMALLHDVTGSGTLQKIFGRVPWLAGKSNPQTRSHIADYLKLSKAGDDLLRDRSATFVLLHLPIPHPKGIYNRKTARLSPTPTTYMGNLALADRYMAHVRSLLVESGQWDSSTVMIMGDHGWRTTFVWEMLPGWTAAEERASAGGKFDDRPAYVVKLAGQKQGARIDEPFHAVETRALMDELLAGKIQSSEDLARWVRQNPGG